ncbi:MAG: hypothetical protein COA43_12535 [Robiginitomaculum sp.]|nr:MAG: hypothetical protein COA43_12535 [Robiginitomaculum sp.]
MTTQKAVEMMIEPGAEALIVQMGRKMHTKARSKVLDRALTHIRATQHSSEVAAWFSEERFLATRRTTVRLSPENADYVETIAAMTGRGRPSILLDIVYLAASRMQKEDFEALR